MSCARRWRDCRSEATTPTPPGAGAAEGASAARRSAGLPPQARREMHPPPTPPFSVLRRINQRLVQHLRERNGKLHAADKELAGCYKDMALSYKLPAADGPQRQQQALVRMLQERNEQLHACHRQKADCQAELHELQLKLAVREAELDTRGPDGGAHAADAQTRRGPADAAHAAAAETRRGSDDRQAAHDPPPPPEKEEQKPQHAVWLTPSAGFVVGRGAGAAAEEPSVDMSEVSSDLGEGRELLCHAEAMRGLLRMLPAKPRAGRAVGSLHHGLPPPLPCVQTASLKQWCSCRAASHGPQQWRQPRLTAPPPAAPLSPDLTVGPCIACVALLLFRRTRVPRCSPAPLLTAWPRQCAPCAQPPNLISHRAERCCASAAGCRWLPPRATCVAVPACMSADASVPHSCMLGRAERGA